MSLHGFDSLFRAVGTQVVPRYTTSLSEVNSEALKSKMERLKMCPKV
jgi:hypothetical protein